MDHLTFTVPSFSYQIIVECIAAQSNDLKSIAFDLILEGKKVEAHELLRKAKFLRNIIANLSDSIDLARANKKTS